MCERQSNQKASKLMTSIDNGPNYYIFFNSNKNMDSYFSYKVVSEG